MPHAGRVSSARRAGGRIVSVVSPGDRAPGGGRFDFAEIPWIHNAGDAMPGGGPFVTLNGFIANTGLNRVGEATFSATLDTTDGRGVADQGLYVQTGGALQLVARTGTVVAGVGTIKRLITRMTESAG